MPTIKKHLSDVQFQSLLNAQLKVNQLQSNLQEAQERLTEITALVLDSLQLTSQGQFELDVQNRQITVEIPDTRPIVPIEDLAPDEE